MTTIKIADDVHPLHASRSRGEGVTSGVQDGIYNMRGVLSRASSMERRSTRLSEKEVEDDDPGLRQSGDYKHKQVCY
jgi:KUP system potassium uptake protein